MSRISYFDLSTIQMSPLRPLVTIKIYLLLWTGAFLFAAIIPFTHRSGSWANAAALTAVYVILSTTVAFAAQHVASGLCRGHVQTGVIAGRGGWGSIAPLLALLGVVGVMLILVDRVHYQGIEYGSGIAGAREQWRQSGEERQGRVSSVFSFVGNMIWPWAYISLGMILAGWESLRQFPRILFLFVALASLLGFSTLNGGRTSLLLALAFIPCVGCARKRAGLSFLPRLFRNDKLLMAILSFAAVVYSSILMSLRARMNDSTPPRLFDEFRHGYARYGNGIFCVYRSNSRSIGRLGLLILLHACANSTPVLGF